MQVFCACQKRVLRDVELDLKQILRYIMFIGKSFYLQIFSPCRIEHEKEQGSDSHSYLQRCYMQNFCACQVRECESTRIEENFTWDDSTGKRVHMQVCYPCRIECEKEKRVVVNLIWKKKTTYRDFA